MINFSYDKEKERLMEEIIYSSKTALFDPERELGNIYEDTINLCNKLNELVDK